MFSEAQSKAGHMRKSFNSSYLKLKPNLKNGDTERNFSKVS